jgi:pimeloyl-ACP methyl ester carboxylesterase
MVTAPTLAVPRVTHAHVDVDGIDVFVRQAGPPDAPVLLLLHGFPTASHQFRRLLDALGTRYRVVAPDYPGFGHSATPLPASLGGPFAYTFDRLADVTERLLDRLGLDRVVLYAFDYGGPVGLRLATRRPTAIAGLVLQDANAYEEGLSPEAREYVALTPETPGATDTIRGLFALDGIRDQYLGGAGDPAAVPPDGWVLDHALLATPERQQLQLDLAFDYHSNVALYPEWQAWLRAWRPPTLVLWGRNDPFFLPAGAEAYRRDVPDAEVHVLESGHFALEDRLPEVVPLVAAFVERAWARPALSPTAPSGTA